MKKLLSLSLFPLAIVTAGHAALLEGDIIGIDFGGTTSTDPSNTWNNISVGGSATTLGLADAGTVVIGSGSLVDTDNVIVSGVSFTFLNSSGQIAWDFSGGADGDGDLIDAAGSTVWGDGIISNDAASRTVVHTTDTFVFTFAGLDDSLTYDLTGGWDSNNANFETIWSADGKSFTTDPNGAANAGFGTIVGLETDGSGNLEIIVSGTNANPAAHITVAALTLTAVPEPSSYALISGALALTSIMVRRRRS
ncbi:MAG: PEP-CTERM sorting domain-containing protein [Opitutaceae bacterium]